MILGLDLVQPYLHTNFTYVNWTCIVHVRSQNGTQQFKHICVKRLDHVFKNLSTIARFNSEHNRVGLMCIIKESINCDAFSIGHTKIKEGISTWF